MVVVYLYSNMKTQEIFVINFPLWSPIVISMWWLQSIIVLAYSCTDLPFTLTHPYWTTHTEPFRHLQNVELVQDARAARAWRDEADILRERASRVEALEQEVARYRDKMADIEFYKTRVEELREDNRYWERGGICSCSEKVIKWWNKIVRRLITRFQNNLIFFSLFLRILVETKEMLEEQLASSRRRAEQVLDLENNILQLKQTVNQISIVSSQISL